LTTTIDVGPVNPAPTYAHLFILVLDGRVSMSEQVEKPTTQCQSTKHIAWNLLGLIKLSRHRKNLSVAVISFAEKTTILTPITSAYEIDDDINYDLAYAGPNQAAIASGLYSATKVAEEFLRRPTESIPASVDIVLISSGTDRNPAEARRSADHIRSNNRICLWTICSSGAASIDPEGQILLSTLATSALIHHRTSCDWPTLHGFFRRLLHHGPTHSLSRT